MEKSCYDGDSRFRLRCRLFLRFFRIGLFTFGGGMAMLPFMRREMAKEGLSEEEIIDCFSLAQSLPGVIAVNSATMVGEKKGGIAGGAAATIGVILPSYIVIIIVILALGRFLNLPKVQWAFSGIRACAAALIILGGIGIAKSALQKKIARPILCEPDAKPKPQTSKYAIFLFALVFILLPLGVSPFYLILLSITLSIGRYFFDLYLCRRRNPKD